MGKFRLWFCSGPRTLDEEQIDVEDDSDNDNNDSDSDSEGPAPVVELPPCHRPAAQPNYYVTQSGRVVRPVRRLSM